MDNLSLTDADTNLGIYLIGVIKGYYEGYDYGTWESARPVPEPGRDAESVDPSSRARFAARAAGGSPSTAATPPAPDPGEGDEARLDAATRRGMVLSLRALTEEFAAAGMVEAALMAERHADALAVSKLRSFE